MCGWIMGWRSVWYHFLVTVTLTSDLVSRIIVSGSYLLYYFRQEFQMVNECILGLQSDACHFGVNVTMTLSLD